MSDIRYIDARDFVEQGYLLEVNRQFLHRLGLALEVSADAKGRATMRVWDYRDDAEGIVFADVTGDEDVVKAERVAAELAAKDAIRQANYGWAVQPVGVSPSASADREKPV